MFLAFWLMGVFDTTKAKEENPPRSALHITLAKPRDTTRGSTEIAYVVQNPSNFSLPIVHLAVSLYDENDNRLANGTSRVSNLAPKAKLAASHN